jgi:hypothetical protein
MQIIRKTSTVLSNALCLMAFSLPLFAAKPIETRWEDVCLVAGRNELRFTIREGSNIDGRCVRVMSSEIVVDTGNHHEVKLERGAFSRIQMRPRGHKLKSLLRDVNGALKSEFRAMLSEAGPFALAGVPATLAWGAAATPFCALGDLKELIEGTQEIRIM